jgi:hypothetical protein
MRIKYYIILLTLLASMIHSQVVRQQIPLEGNNIRSFIWNTGVFNQDMRTNNTPGCEWPKGSGKFVCFSAGLIIGAYLNGQLRLASASYNGEYRPGYSLNGQFFTDSRFRFYKIKKGDNYVNNPDWLNWELMVPYGAPFSDLNNNGIYEYYIDVPGYKGSSETIFICLTDGDPNTHTPSEGFGGGTTPVFSTVGLTVWCYDTLAYKDIQFFRYVVKNGYSNVWDSTICTFYMDPDLGDSGDDYIGCDTLRDLAFTYNADNNDGYGEGRSYGPNPPAFGFRIFSCNSSIASLNTFGTLRGSSSPGPVCERDASNSLEAFRYMNGFKKDGTPWVVPNTNPHKLTTFIYSGDPETQTGWTEYQGRIENCYGQLTGQYIFPSPSGERRKYFSYIPNQRSINPGESFTILAAQLVARGTDHKNSVTKLKQLSDSAKALCQNGFVIGINQIFNEIPTDFNLYQNYPNPFNPATKIKFSIPKSQFVTLKIYDALGREVSTLVNDRVAAGVYSVEWDATAYPSGIYFYSINAGNFTQTRKMILIK